MPYVKQEQREPVNESIVQITDHLNKLETPDKAGTFTYVVYQLVRSTFNGRYWARALGIGCMVCAILEWYRRDHSDAEDEAIKKNGDV